MTAYKVTKKQGDVFRLVYRILQSTSWMDAPTPWTIDHIWPGAKIKYKAFDDWQDE